MFIRETRKRLGLSLHEVASAAGVHFTTWNKWERGRVPAERAHSVAEILNVNVSCVRPDIFTRKPVKTRGKK